MSNESNENIITSSKKTETERKNNDDGDDENLSMSTKSIAKGDEEEDTTISSEQSHKDAAITLSALFTIAARQSPKNNDNSDDNEGNINDSIASRNHNKNNHNLHQKSNKNHNVDDDDNDNDNDSTKLLQSNEVICDENSLSSSSNTSSSSSPTFITPLKGQRKQQHHHLNSSYSSSSSASASKHHYYPTPTHPYPPPHHPSGSYYYPHYHHHHSPEMMYPYHYPPPHHHNRYSYPPPPHPPPHASSTHHDHHEYNKENVVITPTSEQSKPIKPIPFCTPHSNDKSNTSKKVYHPNHGPPPHHPYYYSYLYPPPPPPNISGDVMYDYHEQDSSNEATNNNKRCYLSIVSPSQYNNISRKKQHTIVSGTHNNGNSYSRKDKSLGLLTENFISTFSSPNSVISIDTAASTLCVERRRIYDIINIFESVNIVSRKCKNTYVWHGLLHLPTVFHKLQNEAIKLNKEDAIKNGVIIVTSKDEERIDDIASDDSSASNSYIKEKSLGRLCQKFLQLFLVGHPEMNLTTACQKIYENNAGEEKTKVRRLYDIANVMNSLGVIKKISKGNKPTFSWSFHVSPQDLWLQSQKRKNKKTTLPTSDLTPLRKESDRAPTSPTSIATLKNDEISQQPTLISPDSSQTSSNDIVNNKDNAPCVFSSPPSNEEIEAFKLAMTQVKEINVVSLSRSTSETTTEVLESNCVVDDHCLSKA